MKTIDKNLMEYWYPLIKELDLEIRMPKTTNILLNEEDYRRVCCLEGNEAQWFGIAECINQVRLQKGIGIPFFLRTGVSSGKHSWGETCYISDADSENIARHVFNLYEDDLNKMGITMSDYLFIREFIPMNYSFKAFNAMPISREFRIFSDNGNLTHIQPYWIPESIRRPDKENWKELLKKQHFLDGITRSLLVDTANLVTKAIIGHWSVDFCQAENGQWVLIDMATADDSFKWNPEGYDWNFKSHEERMKEMEKEFSDLYE